MQHPSTLFMALAICALTVLGQQTLEIRNVEIDSQSPEGAVLTEAGIAEDASERIAILDGFLSDFPDSTYLGYVLLQLQGLYTQQQDWTKALEVGKRLLEYVPGDLEVRHNYNQSLVNSQQWPELLDALAATKPLAEKEAATPPPEDPTEDEEILHQNTVDYANGVVQYTEWALNVGVSQAPPDQQIHFMDKLQALFPESQYLAGMDDRYVLAYQQLGDIAGMIGALERALANNPSNEQYLYALAEAALGQKDTEKAAARAEELVQLMEEKPAPEGMPAEEWEAHRKRYSTLGHYIQGSINFNKNAWRTARRHLLQTVDVLREEGGERYGILAWMLGYCYVKLDIAGDNIRQATRWMEEAARVPNPMQAQAAQTLEAIKAAQ